ncbi:MAG TPA: alpha/beta fold hydrolase [Chthoniobacterales bacterium]
MTRRGAPAFLAAAFAFLPPLPTAAEQPADGAQNAQLFEAKAERTIRLPYLLFLPASYSSDPNRDWPLVLYLHGGSLRGDDVERLRRMGLPHRLETDRDFPFIAVAPLCPEGEIWTDTEALIRLLDQVASEHRVDAKRIYVIGHSMGGRGALYTAFKHPERFAGVVALSPVSPITAWAKHLRHVPLWLIHGANDTAAPIADSDELITAMEKAGGQPRYTRLADRDHFILDVFDKNAVFDWLLEHSR